MISPDETAKAPCTAGDLLVDSGGVCSGNVCSLRIFSKKGFPREEKLQVLILKWTYRLLARHIKDELKAARLL